MKNRKTVTIISLLNTLAYFCIVPSIILNNNSKFNNINHSSIKSSEQTEYTAQSNLFFSGASWSSNETIRYTVNGDNFSIVKLNAPDTMSQTSAYFLKTVELSNPTGSAKKYTLVSIESNAFANFSHITGPVTFPDSLKYIGDNAFENCASINTVHFLGNVDSIGKSAFASCSSLTSIINLEKVKQIGESAFKGCEELESINFKNITTINNSVFENCYNLSNITLSDNLILIGDSAFSNCSNLASINLPNTIISVGNNAFYNCSSITGVINLPHAKVGVSTFEGCYNITSINLSKTPNITIPDNLCKSCSSLESISCPSTIESIGKFAFENCNLSKVNLVKWEKLNKIDQSAFANNINMNYINLPKNLKEIGTNAFSTIPKDKSNVSPINIYLNWTKEFITNEFSIIDNGPIWPLIYQTTYNTTSVSFPNNLIFYVPYGLTDFYYQNKEKIGWSGNIVDVGLFILDKSQIIEQPKENNNLILGLSLGLGIPVLAGAITGTVIGVEKHKKVINKKK